MANREKWGNLDFIINSNENCIIKFMIGPVNRTTVAFYLFEKDNKYYLKYVCYSRYEEYDLMIKIMTQNNIEESDRSSDAFYKNPIYQKEFKDRYVSVIKDLDQEFLKRMVEALKNLDLVNHKTTEECYGLDGFGVTSEIFGNGFSSWCHYADPYYKDIFDLLNYLLDLVEADVRYRFTMFEDE